MKSDLTIILLLKERQEYTERFLKYFEKNNKKNMNKEKYEERLKKLEKDGHIIYTKKDLRKHIENLKKEILENKNKITNN